MKELKKIFKKFLDADYRLYITWIIHQQVPGYKVEQKLHLGVRDQKKKKAEYHWSKRCGTLDISQP
jgi:hypothetical protein